MQVNDIVLINNFDLGVLTRIDNDYLTFSTIDFSSHKILLRDDIFVIDTKLINQIIASYYDPLINFATYRSLFCLTSPNTCDLRIIKAGNVKKYSLNLTSFTINDTSLNNQEILNIYQYLAYLFKKLTLVNKYRYVPNLNVKPFYSTLNNYLENPFNLGNLKEMSNLFSHIPDLNFSYNLIRIFSYTKLALLTYLSSLSQLNDTKRFYQELVNDLPFTGEILDTIINFSNIMIDSANPRYLPANINYFFLQQNYEHVLQLIWHNKAAFRNIFKAVPVDYYQYILTKISFSSLTDLIAKMTGKVSANFTLALLETYPYSDNVEFYQKYENTFDFSNSAKLLPISKMIDALSPNKYDDLLYFNKNIANFLNLNVKKTYALAFAFYSYFKLQNIYENPLLNQNPFYKLLIKSSESKKYNVDLATFLQFSLVKPEFADNLDEVTTLHISVCPNDDEKLADINDFNIELLAGDKLVVCLKLNFYNNELELEYLPIAEPFAILSFIINEALMDNNFATTYQKTLVNYQKYLIWQETNNLALDLDNLNLAINNATSVPLAKNNLISLNIKINLVDAKTITSSSATSSFNLAIDIQSGQARSYIVKSLLAFKNALLNNELITYGKNLAFVHTLNNFQSIFHPFLEYFIDNIPVEDSKTIFLNSHTLLHILNLLVGQKISFLEHTDVLVGEPTKLNIFISDDYKITLPNISSLDCFYFIDEKNVLYYSSLTNTLAPLTSTNNLGYLYQFAIKNANKSFLNLKEKLIKNLYLPFKNEISCSSNLLDNISIPEINIKAYFDYENNIISVKSTYSMNEETNLANILPYDYTNQIATYNNYLTSLGFKNNLLTDSNDVIQFLMLDFTYLKTLASVYLSTTLQNKSVTLAKLPTLKMSYSAGIMTCLLADSIYTPTELKQILLALKNKKRYCLLKDNQIIAFKDEDITYANLLDNLGLDETSLYERKALPLYQSFKAIGFYDKVSVDDFLNEMLKDITNYKLYKVSLPNINASLRQYQIEGFKWLSVLNKYHLGGILADDMGLGKTLEVITLLASISASLPTLIVCPKSLIFNWTSEIKRFAPSLKVLSIYGDISTRHTTIKNITADDATIYLTSYESLLRDVELYQNITFSYLIIDEAQAIKNVLAQKSKAVKEIKAENRLALTGTPIENQLLDLWSIFDFLMPNFFPGISTFKEQYQDPHNLAKLALKITPFLLRRTKTDVLKDLPAKYETILTVELTPEERKIYDALIWQTKSELHNGTNSFQILPYLMRLRQTCISTTLIDNSMTTSSKIDMLLGIIDKYTKENHKILVFSAFVEALNLIATRLGKFNIDYYTITGKTKAQERIDLVNDFNANNKVKVFLISLKAGGVGLNLVGADTVIHLDPWWNIAAENQATDRAHRIGQVNNVEVIKLICSNTIEQRVLELQNQKKNLIDNVINNNDDNIVNLTKDDLNYILS